MKRVTNKLVQIAGAVCGISALLITGCATTTDKLAATPSPDANALQIMQHVKEEPSSIRGGGMVYSLFVGGRFSARYNNSSHELSLTDLENNTTCEYDAAGTLTLPENATQSFVDHCNTFSANTAQYLSQ